MSTTNPTWTENTSYNTLAVGTEIEFEKCFEKKQLALFQMRIEGLSTLQLKV